MKVRITVPKSYQENKEFVDQSLKDSYPRNTTELMIAASYGDFATCSKQLQDAGKVNDEGNTALMYACGAGRLHAVQLLIEKEDIRKRNKHGASGVDMAFMARRYEVCGFLEEYCIKNGYNDLKPVIRSTKQGEKQAVKKLKEDYYLEAEDMYPSARKSPQQPLDQIKSVQSKSNCLCGAQFAPNAKFCTECGSKRK